ncbi:hypothetical protein EFY79_01905 [Hanamia caeni]|jgi:predicted transcriptional regulator|uniref:Uncharacterized protein n=1 Tax=Hanamia caeni TaxID=2294116 RepID=A0A3M9NSN5_9BACT|nr:hypothetical protein [Hanamia caeni]RNI40078.1 hypothetical protein EFY79_01905 [Hanamia caeni]
MMATTTIQEEMLQYFGELNIEEQQSILGLIKTFVNRSQRQSLKEYNDELVEGNAQIEAGNYFTHEEVKKRFSK